MARGSGTVHHLKANDNNNTSGGGDGGHPEAEKVAVISEREFDVLLRKCSSHQSDMDTSRATMGQLISAAVENKHLHKGAFGMFRRLHKMDPYKRAELLFHLDIYRERAKWDETDLFPDRDNEAAE
jgi:hypothetical protein